METIELERMWDEFNLVHSDKGCLKNPFYNWEIGTEVNHILDLFNHNLPDIIYDNRLSLPLLEIMWDQFGDIPINNDDEIKQDFYCWKKGTYRFDIWHWFDK